MKAALRLAWVLSCGCMAAFGDGGRTSARVRLPVSEGTDLRFTPVSSAGGPAQGSSRIVEDDQGFLWFGTPDGLKRFDSYGFRDFRPDPKNAQSISGLAVTALFKDRSGHLWVASDLSLDRYDPSTESFTHYPSDPSRFEGPISDIYQDRAGVIWLATSHGLNRIDPSGEMRRYQSDSADPTTLSANTLRSTFEEKDGTFWVASNAA